MWYDKLLVSTFWFLAMALFILFTEQLLIFFTIHVQDVATQNWLRIHITVLKGQCTTAVQFALRYTLSQFQKIETCKEEVWYLRYSLFNLTFDCDLQYLFDTMKDITVLPCGHTIHLDCLKEMEHHNRQELLGQEKSSA